MRHNQLPRRFILNILIVFCFCYALYHIYSPVERVNLAERLARSPACRISPQHEDGRARYGKVVAERPAVVGHSAFIGNPDQCLLAGPRLDPYQSSQVDNLNALRWGKFKSVYPHREHQLM
jgi:hypothetical protein